MRHQDRSNRLGFGGELADSQLQTTTSGLQQTKGTGIGILPAALMECASKQRTFIPHPNTPPTIKGESTNLANLSPPVGVRKEHLDAVQHPPDRNVNGSKSDLLTFRVTGAASVARFEPLLLGREWGGGHAIWSPPTSSASGQGASAIDFVWETTVTKCQRQQHRSARVLNRLVGAQVRPLWHSCKRNCLSSRTHQYGKYCTSGTLFCSRRTPTDSLPTVLYVGSA